MAWVDYELDVSPANFAKIEEGKVTVARLLAVSTRVGGRRLRTRPVNRNGDHVAAGRSRSAQIRKWAVANGIEVSPRGRIPAHIAEAFEAEN